MSPGAPRAGRAGRARVPKDELLPYMGAFAAHLTDTWDTEPPDVVHAHFWMSGFAAVQATAESDVPVLQTFHALGAVKQRWQRAADTSPRERIGIESELARTVDRIVATCSDEVTELSTMGAREDRIDVVPCGVDTDLFCSDGPARRDPSRPARLLALGRLVPRKGVDDAIRALTLVSDATLIVVGGPAPDELGGDAEVRRLSGIAQSCGVDDRVHFTGRLDHDRLPAVIRSCDLVVASPLYEPFGIVPLEAMACAVPVVGTAVGGLLDTVVDGVTGLLVRPGDPPALAAAIATLLADDRLRIAMGAAGQRRVKDHFRWTAVAARTESAYRRALALRQDTSSSSSVGAQR